MKPLFSRQQILDGIIYYGGKFDKEWRIQQHEYEALETRKQRDRNIKRKLDGIMLKSYAHVKEKNQHQNKKKKSKDVFQHLLEHIFIVTEEELQDILKLSKLIGKYDNFVG